MWLYYTVTFWPLIHLPRSITLWQGDLLVLQKLREVSWLATRITEDPKVISAMGDSWYSSAANSNPTGMLGYLILKKFVSASTRSTQAMADAVPATPRPMARAVSPSKVHLHTPRGAQGHTGRREPTWGTPRKSHPAQAPSQSCPRRASAPVLRCPHIRMSQKEQQLSRAPFGLGGEHCQGVCRGRTFWNYTRLTGCLAEASKVGQARDIDGLERNNMGK